MEKQKQKNLGKLYHMRSFQCECCDRCDKTIQPATASGLEMVNATTAKQKQEKGFNKIGTVPSVSLRFQPFEGGSI